MKRIKTPNEFFLGRIEIEPGTYDYNFKFNLPLGLPTSVESSSAHVRYTVRVVIDTTTWPAKEFEERFSVIKPLDLNRDPHYRVSTATFYQIVSRQ